MWIWAGRDCYNTYNDTIVAVRNFWVDDPESAQIKITADSYYRLFVNGVWIADGPARAWPEHYSYDVFDILKFLRRGKNEVRVMARYFGCGTFHSVPQQAGLLAEIEIRRGSGAIELIPTNHLWQVSDGVPWVKNTPKISIQMEPAELYDARLEADFKWADATELFSADNGPWKNLCERRVSYLTRHERGLRRFVKASLIADPSLSFSIAHTRLMHPGLIEANGRVFSPFGIATELVMTSDGEVSFAASKFDRGFFKVAIDGRMLEKDEKIHLTKGRHFVLAFARNILNSDKTISLTLNGSDPFILQNPLSSNDANPWCYIPFREYAFVQNDMVWRWFAGALSEGKDREYEEVTDTLLSAIRHIGGFREQLSAKAENIPFHKMFVEDSYLDFFDRREIREISEQIGDPEALIHDNDSRTIIPPCEKAVELIYDLGEQNCGYYYFDLTSDAGVVIDIFSVEYINPDGAIQFTANNRNGFRYITKQDENRYTSVKRRSGRYLFITLRNVEHEVRIRNIKLIESTYPVVETGIFSCSDERLNRITEISARTLKLCMEDVYTDCPLYEQTLWVGDLRNEALYGYYAFGARDIARNSLLLAAESSERYGMIGAQVPSCWDMVLPAWSFLWGIAAWEYFWYSGDRKFLAILYPQVVNNIKSAEKLITDQGLFSAPYWNFFDWAKIDQEHQTVFHNSMLFVGALRSAVLCAQQMNDPENEAYFRSLVRQLTDSINRLWDAGRKTYPDSLHADGCVSSFSSQHTSFLALLYDIVDPQHAGDVLENLLHPPDEMTQVGSPFTIMYLYEALEKTGYVEHVIGSILNAYCPMLDAGATTVWESYPQGSLAYKSFPTRSHCHGWSASPMYFFQRIILGVRQTSPGCASFEISPHLCGLTQANGTVKTPFGDIVMSWKLCGRSLAVFWKAPPEIAVRFKENNALAAYTIKFLHTDRIAEEKG